MDKWDEALKKIGLPGRQDTSADLPGEEYASALPEIESISDALGSFLVPDSVEVLYSWRTWVVRRQMLLGSINCRAMYPAAEPLVASCNDRNHGHETVPVEGCMCGIYATMKPGTPMGYITNKHVSIRYTVIGIMAQWGKVVVGSRGYRSQYAYPQFMILLPPGDDRVEERIREMKLDHAPLTLHERNAYLIKELYKLYQVPIIFAPRTPDGRGDLNALMTWVNTLEQMPGEQVNQAKVVLDAINTGAWKLNGPIPLHKDEAKAANMIMRPSGGLSGHGLRWI